MAKHSRSEKAFKKCVKVWKDNKEEGKKKANDEKHFSTSLKKLGRITKGNAYIQARHLCTRHSCRSRSYLSLCTK